MKVRDGVGILDERAALINHFEQCIAREIIARWTESTSHNQREVRRSEFTHRACNLRDVIRHSSTLTRCTTNRLQLLRKPSRVAVVDLSEHQFITD
jgi:hypothetical protein